MCERPVGLPPTTVKGVTHVPVVTAAPLSSVKRLKNGPPLATQNVMPGSPAPGVYVQVPLVPVGLSKARPNSEPSIVGNNPELISTAPGTPSSKLNLMMIGDWSGSMFAGMLQFA